MGSRGTTVSYDQWKQVSSGRQELWDKLSDEDKHNILRGSSKDPSNGRRDRWFGDKNKSDHQANLMDLQDDTMEPEDEEPADEVED